MTQDELRAAYARYREMTDKMPGGEFDAICEALGDYRNKHLPSERGVIMPNRVCGMLAVEAMIAWEASEWARD